MEDYRKTLYSNYHTTHVSAVAGAGDVESIKKQFKPWKYYFGRFLPLDKKAQIIDLGCGNGGFVFWLKSLGFENSCGVDVSPEQVELARNNGIQGVQHGDIESVLRAEGRKYDLIFARDVIEHFKKDELPGLLRTVNNSLTENGIFVVQTPNAESIFSGKMRYSDYTHETIFTRESLSQLFASTGFARAGFYPVTPVPKGFKSFVRFLLWKGIEILVRFYCLVETGSAAGVFTRNIIAGVSKIGGGNDGAR